MDYLYEALVKRQNELLELVHLLSSKVHVDQIEKGRLRISSSRGVSQYFYCEKDSRTKKPEQKKPEQKKPEQKKPELKKQKQYKTEQYIPKHEIEKVREIAQNEYEYKLLQEAEHELKSVHRMLKTYEPEKLSCMYEEMNPRRKEVVIPRIVSDEQYAIEWEAVTYTGKEFMNYDSEILTDKGERVRSKSEKIIADFLNRSNIPYRYEHPLALKGIGFVYPDFTILRKRDRKEFYYEHFGMMDHAEYCEKTIRKIDTYARNGIVLGDQLFITFETSKRPIHTEVLGKLTLLFK